MKILSSTSFVAVLGLATIGLLLAQESSPSNRHASAPSILYQSLVEFDSESTTPFVVNPAVAKDLWEADEEIAQETAEKEFESIKARLATLIRQHPHTKAGKDAADMIDRAGLCAGPPAHNSLYPKGTYFGYVPINR